MTGNLSLALLFKAAAPSLALISIGIAWLYWIKAVRAIPAALIGLGLAVFSGMLVIVIGYSFPNAPAFRESLILIGGLPLLVYAATLIFFVRNTEISTIAAVVCGLAGLIPLYLIGGYVLILSACSFSRGGC